MTKIQITPKWKDVKPDGHYVYVHRRLLDGVPFYVGKGRKNRAWQLSGRNDLWRSEATSFGIIVSIIKSNMSEDEAYTLEYNVISYLTDIGIILTNMSLGGHGSRGHNREKFEVSVYCSNGMTFKSIDNAELWLKSNGHPKASGSAITSCCKGKRNFAYGHTWSTIDFPEPPKLNAKELAKSRSREVRGKKVYDSFGNVFESIGEARDYLKLEGYKNASHSPICNYIKGNQRAAYGRAWSHEGVPDHPSDFLRRPKVQVSKGKKR